MINPFKIKLLLSLSFSSLLAESMSLQDFYQAIERNSIDLINKKAQYQSNLEDQKSLISWDYPYVETDVSMVKNPQNKIEPQTTALLMITPKLPWVSTMLYQSLHLKTAQYKKSYELAKNLNFISAKRLYLNYIFTKEKYDIYTRREENYLSQLQIARQRVEAGSMSEKDFINFRNSYLESKLAKTNVTSELTKLEKTLETLIAREGSLANVYTNEDEKIGDIKVVGLDFDYIKLGQMSLEEMSKNSLYIDIIDLSAKDYQTNAKLANRDRFHNFEIGAGIENANSSTNASIKLQIPLPITPKNDHIKKKYLALQSGAIKQSEVMKRNIRIQTFSYANQLKNKEKYIQIQKENIQNKKHLMEMGKIAYEAQKIGLFEYLIYQNSYMDALITLADAKIDYVNTAALLEETLGESLDKSLTNIGEKK